MGGSGTTIKRTRSRRGRRGLRGPRGLRRRLGPGLASPCGLGPERGQGRALTFRWVGSAHPTDWIDRPYHNMVVGRIFNTICVNIV